ncbi:MAG: alpha/beta hydrolase [Vicinamibacterales bacterium]|nr:alpha/beta hydrolase [Vicinamibacterales bacterium]
MPSLVIDGHRIEYRLDAPRRPGYPTVVFLHEGLGALSAWRDFPDRLAARTGCGVLAYSRWGYGESDRRPLPWPATYLHDEARTELPALLEQTGITRPILFGHSDGGSIALIAAALYPGLAAGIITEAAHVMIETTTTDGLAALANRYTDGTLRTGLQRVHGDKVDDVFNGWSGVWALPEMRDWTLYADLPNIVCPVLAVQGTDDEFGTPAQVEVIVSLVAGPAEPWLIDGCGHTPHREREEAVLARAAEFVLGVGSF